MTTKTKGKKITINDIARICGVSTGTINRALHNKSDINPKTKEKILGAIKKYNYRPNYYARALASGKSNTIGIIVPDVENEFFTMTYSIIEKRCWENNYYVSLVLSKDNPERELKNVKLFIEQRLDGIIMFPVSHDNKSVRLALSSGIDTILIFNSLPKENLSSVVVHDYNAMCKNVQYLINLGHKNIAYIDGYRKYSPTYNDHINKERYRAFRETLQKNNIQIDKNNYFEFKPEYYKSNDYSIIKSIVGSTKKITAIVCFHDRIALCVMQGLEKIGVKVPNSISVTGFDDINELKYIKPRLTTSAIPVDKIAEKAISILMNSIKGKRNKVQKIMFPVKFIEGETCMPPKGN